MSLSGERLTRRGHTWLWLGWVFELGEAGFQGSLWAERPLSSAVMTSGPWRLMCGGTSAPHESPAPPARSRTRTAAQSQQVRPARIRWRTRPLPEAPAAGAVAVSAEASDPLGRRGRAAPRPRPAPLPPSRGDVSPPAGLRPPHPRRCVPAAAPRFCHSLDLAARGTSRASVTYAIFFPPQKLCVFV